MGRPPLPAGTARTVTYSVKWTELEAKCLQRGAEAIGVSVPEFIRQVLQQCAIPALAKSLEIQECLRLQEERQAKRRKQLDERRKKIGK